jgi:hypothetical protein
MIACPACKRRVVGPAEMLRANLDGSVQCPACGAFAGLDQISRFFVACPLAFLLWLAVLYWDILFSGYLFLFSTVVILAGWRVLSAVGTPILGLEISRGGAVFNRKQTLVSLAIMIGTAVAIDGFMSYRTEAEAGQTTAAAPRPEARSP